QSVRRCVRQRGKIGAVERLRLTAFAILTATSCSIDPLDATDKACPCAEGWTCDTNINVCIESASYRNQVLLDKPLGYWRFNESAGLKALNEVADGAIGQYQGSFGLGQPGALSSDPSNKAARFDGNRDMFEGRVDFLDNFGFEGTHPFTLEVWMAPR